MEKILLVFLNELEKEEGLNKVIDKFSQNNYKIYILDNIKKDEYFSFDSLPQLVESYRNELGIENKIAVLSNSRDLIFSWYRCYNSIVDDFIYFIDNDKKSFFNRKERHFNFFSSLAEFNSIEKEKLKNNIYININFENYKDIIEFLLENKNFRYFDKLDRFEFEKNIVLNREDIVSKEYLYSGYKYNFGVINMEKIETIKIVKKNKEEFDLSFFSNNIESYHYLIPYITTLFYKYNNEQLTNLLVIFYKELKEISEKKQKKIYEELYMYISNNNLEFKEKIYISSLLVMISSGDERLTEFMMKTLLEDNYYIESHYEVLANILFYHSNENLKRHMNYEIDRKKLVEKLSELNAHQISRRNEQEIKIDRIIILVDQLLSLVHSPSSWTLYFSKIIKKTHPGIKVKIVVEENLHCNNYDKILAYYFSSVQSKECREIHNSYLADFDIDIYYCSNNIKSSKKITNTAEVIDRFKPDVIFYTSPISAVAKTLYKYYPTTYMSYNDFNFTVPSHIYLLRDKGKAIKENRKHKLLNESRVYEFNPGIEYNEPKSKYDRIKFNIDKKDFVMVTVGNRLDAEISNDFAEMVISVIKENENVKWVIVGSCSLSYIKSNFPDIFIKNIVKINYESDLPALYNICDIYINPIRTTGGTSILMAMHASLPIVMSSNHSDVINYIGVENTCGYRMENLKKEIKFLYEDEEHREKIGNMMRDKMTSLNYKKDANDLLHYFQKAIINFNEPIY